MPGLRLFYIFNSLFIFKYLPKTSCITNKHPVSLVQFMNIVPAQHWIFVSLIIVMTVITHNSANAEQTLQILPSENFFFFPVGYIYKKGIKNGLQMRKTRLVGIFLGIWAIFVLLCFASLCFALLHNLCISLHVHVPNSHPALLCPPVQELVLGTSQLEVSFLSSKLPTLQSKDAQERWQKSKRMEGK